MAAGANGRGECSIRYVMSSSLGEPAEGDGRQRGDNYRRCHRDIGRRAVL